MNFEVVMLFTQQVFHTLCFFLLLIPEIVIISTQISVVFLIKVLLIKKTSNVVLQFSKHEEMIFPHEFFLCLSRMST